MEQKLEAEHDNGVFNNRATVLAQSNVEISMELTADGKQKLHVTSTKDGVSLGVQAEEAFTAEAVKDMVFITLAALAIRVNLWQPTAGAQDETEPQ